MHTFVFFEEKKSELTKYDQNRKDSYSKIPRVGVARFARVCYDTGCGEPTPSPPESEWGKKHDTTKALAPNTASCRRARRTHGERQGKRALPAPGHVEAEPPVAHRDVRRRQTEFSRGHGGARHGPRQKIIREAVENWSARRFKRRCEPLSTSFHGTGAPGFFFSAASEPQIHHIK